MNEWQPIETARKDGRHILLWFPIYKYSIWTGQWDGQRWRISTTGLSNRANPTHWMPLPEPPA